MNQGENSDVTRLWQKQAMPAPESVWILSGYFGAKTWKFIHLPALAQIPGYVTGCATTTTLSANSKQMGSEDKQND